MKEKGNLESGMLSIHNLCRQGTTVLGPGNRYVIWTQGCPFHCDGCITPESRPITHEKMVYVRDLAEDVISCTNINGITVSGGEPFLQAKSLSEFLGIVLDKRPELTVLFYTGYKMEALTWPDAQKLLSMIDLLIDGPYISKLDDDTSIRGSSNQRFIYLTQRLVPFKEEIEQGKRKVEYHLTNGMVIAYGVPSSKMKQLI